MTSPGSEVRAIPNFSVLCDDSARNAVVLHLEETTDRFDLLKGVETETRPVRFRAPPGRHGWPDLVATDAVVLYLISTRFRDALRDADISGWHTRKVEVNRDVGGDHELLVVTGRCGAVDDQLSERASRKNKSGVQYMVWTGLFFDPATWDGSDAFCPADSGLIFMTRRAATAIEKAKLKNVRLDDGISFERLAL